MRLPAAAAPAPMSTNSLTTKEPPLNASTPNAHYDVVESRILCSEHDTSQMVTVGRSNAGVHLTLTPDAAIALATILTAHITLLKSLMKAKYLLETPNAVSIDLDLWTHTVVDLEAQKALHAVRDTIEDLAVSVGVLDSEAPGEPIEGDDTADRGSVPMPGEPIGIPPTPITPLKHQEADR